MSLLLGCSNIYPPALTDPPTYLHRLKLFLPPHLIACFASHAAVERAVSRPRSGILSFASTTFILSMFNVNARGITIPNVVVGMAIFSGGLVQFIAGMWEYPRGNLFGATGACLSLIFCLYIFLAQRVWSVHGAAAACPLHLIHTSQPFRPRCAELASCGPPRRARSAPKFLKRSGDHAR